MVIDPKTETQEPFSPYHYTFNNPVRFRDPDGREPCCDGLVDFMTGVGQALSEDLTGGSPIQANPGNANAFNNGLTAGHYAAMVVGAAEVVAGAVGIGGSAVAEVGSLGLATPAVVASVASSAAVAAHGAAAGMRASENLRNDEGRVNTEGNGSGSGDQTRSNSRAGKPFTPAEKAKVIDANGAKNQGKIICEGCGVTTTKPNKSTKGVTPPKTDRQIDHKIAKSKGGSGTADNGQVLCRDCNRKKSNN